MYLAIEIIKAVAIVYLIFCAACWVLAGIMWVGENL